MSNWLSFSILWMLTGSPITAALVLLAVYAVADWYTFGFLRGAARAWADYRRGHRLRIVLLQNPHDRKARADWGEILLSQRRYAKVIEVVKPLADEDPHSLIALYLLGVACLATGRAEQGGLFLEEVHAASPAFRDGAALLELGRWKLKRGDKTSVEPLAKYVAAHPHSVEARWLLCSAHRLAGDAKAAAAERERCWIEYETELPYQRRRDRLWAWRAKPSRPALYAAVACAALLVAGMLITRAASARPLPGDVRAASMTGR